MRFNILFNSISVKSERRMGGNERLGAMESRLRPKRFPPPTGIEPGTVKLTGQRLKCSVNFRSGIVMANYYKAWGRFVDVSIDALRDTAKEEWNQKFPNTKSYGMLPITIKLKNSM